MTFLVVAQTIFYLVFSLAMVVLIVALILITYYIIETVRLLRRIAKYVEHVSGETKTLLAELIGSFSSLPFLSLLLRKSRKKPKDRLGRENE